MPYMTFSQQYRAISRSLSPIQKLHSRQALIHLVKQNGFHGTPNLIRQRVGNALRIHRAFAKESEIDSMTFYVLARLAWVTSNVMTTQGTKGLNYESTLAYRETLADMAASIKEMSEMDVMQLQRMMDKKHQLELTIANVLNAGCESGQSLVDALKAS